MALSRWFLRSVLGRLDTQDRALEQLVSNQEKIMSTQEKMSAAVDAAVAVMAQAATVIQTRDDSQFDAMADKLAAATDVLRSAMPAPAALAPDALVAPLPATPATPAA